jgi:hypothetical protein
MKSKINEIKKKVNTMPLIIDSKKITDKKK